nr:MAG TPA: hypothetical protein [Bacteriophage sp.]
MIHGHTACGKGWLDHRFSCVQGSFPGSAGYRGKGCPVYLRSAGVKAAEKDVQCIISVVVLPLRHGLYRNGRGLFQRVAVSTGGNGWKSNAVDVVFPGKVQRIAVAAGQQHGVLGGAGVHRPHRVDNPGGFQAVAFGDLGFAGAAAVQRKAFGQQLRAGGTVNGTVHTAAAQQAAVGGIHDAVAVQCGDIALEDFKMDRHKILPFCVRRKREKWTPPVYHSRGIKTKKEHPAVGAPFLVGTMARSAQSFSLIFSFSTTQPAMSPITLTQVAPISHRVLMLM